MLKYNTALWLTFFYNTFYNADGEASINTIDCVENNFWIRVNDWLSVIKSHTI